MASPPTSPASKISPLISDSSSKVSNASIICKEQIDWELNTSKSRETRCLMREALTLQIIIHVISLFAWMVWFADCSYEIIHWLADKLISWLISQSLLKVIYLIKKKHQAMSSGYSLAWHGILKMFICGIYCIYHLMHKWEIPYVYGTFNKTGCWYYRGSQQQLFNCSAGLLSLPPTYFLRVNTIKKISILWENTGENSRIKTKKDEWD